MNIDVRKITKKINIPEIREKISNVSKKKAVICIIAIVLAFAVIFELSASLKVAGVLFVPDKYVSYVKKHTKKNLTLSDGEHPTYYYYGSSKWLENAAKDEYTDAEDGTKLHALSLKNANVSHSYAILCHPYTANALSMAGYAEHYYDLGFNIVLVDARGHGESGGKYSTLGAADGKDLLKWIDKLIEEDADAQIVIHGVSLGGTAAAYVSGEKLPDNVKCIIDDCGISSGYDEVRFLVKEFFGYPVFPTASLVNLVSKIKYGVDTKEIDILEQVKNSEKPILFIHGQRDDVVPVAQGNKLYDACSSEDKEQYNERSSGHAQSVKTDPEKYWLEVDKFILSQLGF